MAAGKEVSEEIEEMSKEVRQLQTGQKDLAALVESRLDFIEEQLCSVGDQSSCSGIDELEALFGTASHLYSGASSPASNVYELRFYTFGLEGKKNFQQLHEDREFWAMRQTFSKVVGIWETELNGITEFFHIVEYDSLEALLKDRKALAESKGFWPKAEKVVKQYGTFRNCLTHLIPDSSSLQTQFPPSDTAVYELQTMRRNDCTPTLGKDGVLVGCFNTIYGKANIEYRLIRFPNAQAAENAARIRMTRNYEMRTMLETRLMVPMPVSDLQ